MLSERENRTLAEIEEHMSADDPALARRLADGVPGKGDPRRRLWTVALVLVLVMMAVSMVLGLPTATGLTAVLATVLAGIRFMHSRAASPGVDPS